MENINPLAFKAKVDDPNASSGTLAASDRQKLDYYSRIMLEMNSQLLMNLSVFFCVYTLSNGSEDKLCFIPIPGTILGKAVLKCCHTCTYSGKEVVEYGY